MGCAVSLRRYGGGEDQDDLLVSLCRERKRLMKSAVDRRYALAGAHSKYNQSLYAVALALRLFVARHSSSQFLITFPTPSVEPKPAAVTNAAEEAEEEESIGPVCEHFYEDGAVDPTPAVMTSASSSQQNREDIGSWDFFNPFDNLTVDGDAEKELKAEEEGGGDANVNLKVIDATKEEDSGRELLEALKEVEDHFLKAYECGIEFSKLLEFTSVPPIHHLDSKECCEKLIPSIAWHKSSLTGSPSCRSLLSSSSRSSSTWTGINSDLFDETAGMESGSHLSTLGRLYAWEKKLYDEVKAGNEMKKVYDRKCAHLSTENGSNKQGGMHEQVKDLHSRLLVSIKICNSISKRIEQVRDDELQPQLIELLHGLTRSWKVLLESHKRQSQTMFQVKTFPCGDMTNDPSRHLVTLQLEAEIENWRTCFSSYIESKQAYLEALSEWAYRSIALEKECLVCTICRDWLSATKSLPDKAVAYAMKKLAKDLRGLWGQQEMEQQQKRKVERLVAEWKKRVAGYEKIVRSKALKKGEVDGFMKMVEREKAREKECVEETRRVMLVGFQTGFASVFDSLAEFSEICVRKYDDVLGSNRVLEGVV